MDNFVFVVFLFLLNPEFILQYCSFCQKECWKCDLETECLHHIIEKRPPNCGYCKYCKLCSVCDVAKSVCSTMGSWADWVSDSLLSKHVDDIKAAPTHNKIKDDIRRSNHNLDEL